MRGSPGTSKSAEHRQKLREAAQRRYQQPHEREQQSARMKAVYDKMDTHAFQQPDARAKQAQTLTTLWTTNDYRNRVLTARSTPEVRHKLHTAARRQWSTPETRDNTLDGIRAARRVHLTEQAQGLLSDPDWLRTQNQTRTITDIADELGVAQGTLSRIFDQHQIIPITHPPQHGGEEDACAERIRQHFPSVTFVSRDRIVLAPQEIDLWCPSQQVGVEYHGLYWHSFGRIESAEERTRHQRKAIRAHQAGIRLLQFWSAEWQKHPDICLGMIQSALHLNTRIGARTCAVRAISATEATTFLTSQHLHGSVPAKLRFGLFHPDGTLLMVMTFGKTRFGTKSSWELLRMATALGWTVTGGVQKLWSVAKTHLSGTVVSYANARFYTGESYQAMGWTQQRLTPPGYSYTNGHQVFSRQQFQKSALKTRWTDYDPIRTEAENVFRHGYRRVWDAGHYLWSIDLPRS